MKHVLISATSRRRRSRLQAARQRARELARPAGFEVSCLLCSSLRVSSQMPSSKR